MFSLRVLQAVLFGQSNFVAEFGAARESCFVSTTFDILFGASNSSLPKTAVNELWEFETKTLNQDEKCWVRFSGVTGCELEMISRNSQGFSAAIRRNARRLIGLRTWRFIKK